MARQPSTSQLLKQAAQNAQPVSSDAKDFSPPEKIRADDAAIRRDMLRQTIRHRQQLLDFVKPMAAWSFVFLVFIVVSQMIIRFWKPGYTGASDTVINIVTVGVFGQVIGIVASMVTMVFRDSGPDSNKGSGG